MSKFLLEHQESDRLVFRKILLSDFNDWLPFYFEPLATKYWSGLPSNPKIACQEQFDRIFERYDNDLGGMNALISKTSGKLIGLCGLLVQIVDDMEELEIGYSVLPEYWQQGYAFEAAHKCKTVAFEQQFTNRLISIIHIDNIPSQKVAIKNGMNLDKTTSYKANPVHIYSVYNH